MRASPRARKQRMADSRTQGQGTVKLQPLVSSAATVSSADSTYGMVAKPSTLPSTAPSPHYPLETSSSSLSPYQSNRLQTLEQSRQSSPNRTDIRPRHHLHRTPYWPSQEVSNVNRNLALAAAPSEYPSLHVPTSMKLQRHFDIQNDVLLTHDHAWKCKSPDAFISRSGDPPFRFLTNSHDPHGPSHAANHYPSISPVRIYSDCPPLELATDISQMEKILPSLRPFHPMPQRVIDSRHRPKTSRGPDHRHTMFGQVPLPHSAISLHGYSEQSPARQSVFMEGSMNKSSRAVASSWLDIDPATEPEQWTNEHDADGRGNTIASRDSSVDIAEFRPLPPTPSRLKNTLMRFTGRSKAATGGTPLPNSDSTSTLRRQKKHRSRLGSSISTLSDKIRSFGSSNSETRTGNDVKQTSTEQNNLLAERKRKAEEAYASQFGFKKQKDNFGLATIASPTATRQRVAVSKAGDATNATIRPYSSPYGGSRSPITNISAFHGDHTMLVPPPQSGSSVRGIDQRKRPTRAELEKENQQLRALLRESEAQKQNRFERPTTARSTCSNTSFHLAPTSSVKLVSQDDLSPPRTNNDERSASPIVTTYASPKSSPRPLKRRTRSDSRGSVNHRAADVPPVPALPSRIPERNILAPVTGNTARPAVATGADSTAKDDSQSISPFRLAQNSPLRSHPQAQSKFKLKSSTLPIKDKRGCDDRQQSIHCASNKQAVPILWPSSMQKHDENKENAVGNRKSPSPTLQGREKANAVFKGVPDPMKREEEFVWPDDVF